MIRTDMPAQLRGGEHTLRTADPFAEGIVWCSEFERLTHALRGSGEGAAIACPRLNRAVMFSRASQRKVRHWRSAQSRKMVRA